MFEEYHFMVAADASLALAATSLQLESQAAYTNLVAQEIPGADGLVSRTLDISAGPQ